MKYTLDWLTDPEVLQSTESQHIPTTESMQTIRKPMQTIPL